jgi:zinc protease
MGKEEQSLVYMGRYVPASYSEEDAAAAAVLNEYLDIRFVEEIREKRGGVYSVSVGVSLSPFLPEGELSMNISFGCDPKRVEELSAAIEEEVNRVVQAPIDRDIFAKSIEAMKKSWESLIESNSYIAQSYANSLVIYESPLNRLNKRPALYDTVSPEAMQAICRRLLEKGPIRIILYPEEYKK